MSNTLETTNNLILVKIKCLIDICGIINIYETGYKYKTTKILDELNDILNNYEIGSVKILADYFLLINEYHMNLKRLQDTKEEISDLIDKKSEHALNSQNMIDVSIKELKNHHNKNEEDYFSKYQAFIKKYNFVDKINRYYNIIRNVVSGCSNIKSKKNKRRNKHNLISPLITVEDNEYISDNDLDKIRLYLKKYESSEINHTTVNNIYNKCKICDTDMQIISSTSEMVCTFCGITESLYGTVLEDEQFYFQDGHRAKHGSYDPSKHCRFWIERIQGRETKDIPDTVLNDVRKCIRDNNVINVEDITCKEIRTYLSMTNHTSYNKHIPLIRKIITGEPPAQLTDQELQIIQIYFDKVIRIYDDIKPITKTSVPYHPYLIYKIIEHLLHTKAKLEGRKSKDRIIGVLSCIHLQARETLIENDKMWKKICECLVDITYRPTDKNNSYDDL